MNSTAFISGINYKLLETLPQVHGSGHVVVCQNDSGERLACPLELWEASAEAVVSNTSVNLRSSSESKISLFRSLFHGRDDVYARRWENQRTGKSGYSPACKNEWEQGLCDKRSTPCSRCANRELIPLTDAAVYRHLEGRDKKCRDVIGVYPLLPDETVYFLAVDFDGDGWMEDVSAFVSVCNEYALVPSVERSRSGNGGHVWFFFASSVSAANARRLGSGLLTQAMDRHPELKMRSYDRLFPNQDTLPKGGFGNLIALPLQGQARRAGNSVFVDENFQPYTDQWAYLSGVERITAAQLDELLGAVCQGSELGELIAAEPEEDKPWEHTKPAKLTALDFPPSVELTLADGLYVKREGISARAQNRTKRLAAFRNPDFYRSQAMRLPTYNKPRIIDTAKLLPDYIHLPRGCLDNLTELLPGYTIDDKRTHGRDIAVSFNGELRDEQRTAAEAMLSHDTGVLSATTAFGKTVVGAYIIGQRKVNTLILVHSTALLSQWKKALEQFLLIDETLPELPRKRGRKRKLSLIGQLGGGKNALSGIVDIAVMQSLFEGDEVKALVRDYGMVICDECHHVPAVSFERVLSAATAKYVYGLSATPIRQDGHQSIIFMQCGPIRYRVDAKAQAEKRDFEHFVIPHFTSLHVPDFGELSIQELYTKLTKSAARNRQIVTDVRSTLNEGRTPLVLTERKEHADTLAGLLSSSCPNVLLLIGGDGQKAKREKLEALKAIPQDEPLIVVATGKYIGEGFDEPRLDTLFLAMPIAWKGTLAQYAGRLHRECNGKREVRIYDYIDIHVKVLERMYQKRLRGYGELGYHVKASSSDSRPGLIFDNRSFYAPFASDITEAVRDILIVSPFIRKARTSSMLMLLLEPLTSGVKVTIVTRPAEDYKPEQQASIALLINMLTDAGVSVVTRSQIHQKFAVIDRSIVWYGSINLLSFGSSEESIMRFENTDIAGELFDMKG